MTRKAVRRGKIVDLREARRLGTVSDHALVRWMERVMLLDLDQIRREILSETVLMGMAANASAVVGPGYKLILENFVVVTTLPSNKPAAVSHERREKVEG